MRGQRVTIREIANDKILICLKKEKKKYLKNLRKNEIMKETLKRGKLGY